MHGRRLLALPLPVPRNLQPLHLLGMAQTERFTQGIGRIFMPFPARPLTRHASLCYRVNFGPEEITGTVPFFVFKA